MRVDSTLVLKVEELDRQQWRRLFTQLTFFDADDQQIQAYQASDGVVRLPRGVWSMLPSKVVATDLRAKPPMPKVEFTHTLDEKGYGGQADAVAEMFRHEQGQIVIPPGGGKTEIGLAFAAQCETRTLVVVHTKDLFEQWVTRAKVASPEMSIGEIRASKSQVGHLTIAMAQTLKKHLSDGGKFWRQFGAIIIDECFVAGTLVDGKPIESCRVGDKVTAFNEKTGKLVQSKVARLFKSRPSALVRLTVGGKQIVCTPGHPFWTKEGWVPAGLLTSSSMVLLYDHEEENEMPRVQCDSDAGLQREQSQVGLIPPRGADVLFSEMPNKLPTTGIVSANERDESEVCVGSNDAKEPNGAARGSSETKRDSESNGPSACDQGWQWSGANSSTSVVGQDSWLADGIQREDRLEQSGTSLGLQGGSCQSDCNDSYRSGRPESSNLEGESERCQERRVSAWVGVDSVAVLKPGSDGRFGGLCPDGFVYNLEVENQHTYLADDVVVHNCHHAAAETWEWLLNTCPAYYRFGLTATKRRADGRQNLVTFYIGPVIKEVAFQSKVPLEVQPVRTGFKGRYRGPFDWSRMLRQLSEDPERNARIAGLIVHEAYEKHCVLVLSRQIKHLEAMASEIDRIEAQVPTALSYAVMTGSMPQKRRNEIMADFRSGKINVLLATQLADEGLDVPMLDRVFLTFPGKHDGRIIQQIGRAIRQYPDKEDAKVYDFVDDFVPPLARQFVARKRTYKQLGIPTKGAIGYGTDTEKKENRGIHHPFSVARSGRS